MSFLKKIIQPKKKFSPLRPPGAIVEMLFTTQCTRCGKCKDVCQYHAIKLVTGEECLELGRLTPVIVPQEVPCYLCMECIKACPTGALKMVEKEKVKMGLASVNDGMCLNYGKGACQGCVNACPFPNAAVFIKDGIARINPDTCVGCGLCVNACVGLPSAITVKPAHIIFAKEKP